jgi:hypothetical protein
MTKTIVLAALLFGATVAHAQVPSDDAKKAEAKSWYEQGLSAYNLGNFPKAIEAFTKAYELSQAPGLLFNIAQSHRLNKEYEKASYFYSTYLRLKPDAPNRADVEARIKEMDEALEKQKKIESSPPTGTMTPDGTGATPSKTGTATTTTTGTTTTGTTTTGTTTTGTTTTGGGTPANAQPNATRPTTGAGTATTTTGALESPDGAPTDTGGVSGSTTVTGPTMILARFTAGAALLKSADLDIPVQPSIGITAAYPLRLGSVTLELGAGFSWTPLPYENAEGQQRGRMIGVRAIAAVVREVAPKVQLRGDLGVGMLLLGGLQQGNPISDMRQAQSFTRPNFHFGVSADYAVTPNVVAYISPFGIGFSSGSADMYGGIREIDFLLGVGYQQ